MIEECSSSAKNAHGRYNSLMSMQTWRSSGGISAYGGVVVFSIKTGAEELTSTFKDIQLINEGYGGETPPPPSHHPRCDPNKNLVARSLGGRGGPRRRIH